MLVGNKAPANLVVDFASISVYIELGVFSEFSLSAEAVGTHYEVLVARRVIAVIIFAQWDIPFLESFNSVFPEWSAVLFGLDSGFPLIWQEVLKSCICTGPGLFNE